jgi:hypothetical protein
MPYLYKDAKANHNRNYYLTKIKKSRDVQPDKTLEAPEAPYKYTPYVPPAAVQVRIADGTQIYVQRRNSVKV